MTYSEVPFWTKSILIMIIVGIIIVAVAAASAVLILFYFSILRKLAKLPINEWRCPRLQCWQCSVLVLMRHLISMMHTRVKLYLYCI